MEERSGSDICSGFVSFFSLPSFSADNAEPPALFTQQEERLLLTDPAALNHVLNSHVDTYPKPPVLLADVKMLLGGGVGGVDGVLSSYLADAELR
jgi:hypothetical protein